MSMVIDLKDSFESYHELEEKRWLQQRSDCNIKEVFKGGYTMCGISSRECGKEDCFGRVWLKWK
jgi:hypothetical protein